MIRFVNLLIILFAVEAYSEVDWRGHNRLITTNPSDQYVLNHRSTFLHTKDEHTFEIAYELFLQYDQKKQNLDIARFEYRSDDIDYLAIDRSGDNKSEINLVQNLDRLFYSYSTDTSEIKLGRQPISFGSARQVNSLDILVPYAFLNVNFEERLGVDGYRYKYSFSDMGVLDIGGAVDSELDSDKEFKFAGIQETIGSNDILLIAQSLKGHNLYGVDIQSSIKGWGVWFQGAYVDLYEQEDFYRFTLGGQYHFKDDVDLVVEYHHNGLDSANLDLGIFVLDKNYFTIALSYLLTPLESLSVRIFSNLEDSSSLISASYQYSLKQDWFIDAGIFTGQGSNTSEFINYPNTFFASLKNFF